MLKAVTPAMAEAYNVKSGLHVLLFRVVCSPAFQNRTILKGEFWCALLVLKAEKGRIDAKAEIVVVV